MLWVTRGYAAPETIEATERAAALAEKSGNLTQLVNSVIVERSSPPSSRATYPPPVRLPTRRSSLPFAKAVPPVSRRAHALQIMTRYWLWRPRRRREAFHSRAQVFRRPRLQAVSRSAVVAAFGFASLNAWMLGRADVARERMAQMMAAANGNNPYDVATSGYCAAHLRVYLREYEQAEALAARALELSEKHQFPLCGSTCPMYSRSGASAARPRDRGYRTDSPGNSWLARNRDAPGHQPLIRRGWRRRRSAKAPSSTRLKRSNRRSRRIPTNSYTGPRRSGYAANCGSNRGRRNWPRPTSARLSRSRKRWARKRGNCAQR